MIISLPSPVERLDKGPFASTNNRFFIKRDDKINPFISGNKWRKLTGYVEIACNNQVQTLATYGGAFSNHLIATACAGYKYGFKTIGYIRGSYADTGNEVLYWCRIFGMEIKPLAIAEYNSKSRAEWHIIDDTLYIPEGGYGKPVLAGFRQMINELTETYGYLFCAIGTGATLAGLCSALNNAGSSTQICGVSVLKNGGYLVNEVITLYPEAKFSFFDNFHFGGYAKVPPEVISFINQVYTQCHIAFDGVYTAKMAMAALALDAAGKLGKSKDILLLHTGGITGMLSETMRKKFLEINPGKF